MATKKAVGEKTEKGEVAKGTTPVTGKRLVKKAYEKIAAKLNEGKEDSKAIDDLVKLVKLEKDLGGGEKAGVREIRVRWVPSEKQESSNEG